ncbi:hypothetical protein QH639_19210 [Lysinibacillus sp. 1 U-2021]|uniref:hypothetical protein n=1 Tax=Lysinibacillus sp. 1 U-2021 TaxID=3039426 RepID=UPI00247FF7DB|nr:hypothetical protein [Lysinibacillus sp. 1 U-2021]WGT37932.1 hypothetical protein QH639_19210 [Lysinibacillus sp. 1 U-2021]
MQDYILSFNKINVEENKIDRLLSLLVGVMEKEAYVVFNKIKTHYSEIDYPDVVLDLMDEYMEIIDDYRITFEDAVDLADSMGWDLINVKMKNSID